MGLWFLHMCSILEKWGKGEMEGDCSGQTRIKLKARTQSAVADTESALIYKLGVIYLLHLSATVALFCKINSEKQFLTFLQVTFPGHHSDLLE